VQEVEGGGFLTYVLPPGNLDAFLAEARRRLTEAVADSELELTWRWQPQEDWESLWRRGLGARQITSRLLVAPSWEPVHPDPDQVVVTLDPGMAFGTAEHASTRGSLRALDALVRSGCRVADVGAGSGILSIASALLGAAEVLALEVDPMACETAAANLAINGVGHRVRIACARVEGPGPLPGAPYDGIAANLQTHLLLPLLSTFRLSLAAGGWAILSGVLLEERDLLLASAVAAGFVLLREDVEDGWWTGAFHRSNQGP